jgi:WD40 repeat protein
VSDGVELWNFSGLGHGNGDGHNQNVQGVAFSPDGRRLASGSLDGTVKILDVAERRHERTIRGHADRVWGVAFSPDGRLVASTSSDRTARLWRVDDGGLERTLLGHEEEVRSAIAFNRDGSLVAAASNFEVAEHPTRRMEVRIWRVATGEVAAVVDAHRNTVRSVAFSPRDPAQFATASYDRTVRLWDLTGI